MKKPHEDFLPPKADEHVPTVRDPIKQLKEIMCQKRTLNILELLHLAKSTKTEETGTLLFIIMGKKKIEDVVTEFVKHYQAVADEMQRYRRNVSVLDYHSCLKHDNKYDGQQYYFISDPSYQTETVHDQQNDSLKMSSVLLASSKELTIHVVMSDDMALLLFILASSKHKSYGQTEFNFQEVYIFEPNCRTLTSIRELLESFPLFAQKQNVEEDHSGSLNSYGIHEPNHTAQTSQKDLIETLRQPAKEQNSEKDTVVMEVNSDALPLLKGTHEPNDNNLTVLNDLDESCMISTHTPNIEEVSAVDHEDNEVMHTPPAKEQNPDKVSIVGEVNSVAFPLWKRTHEPTVLNDFDTLTTEKQNIKVLAAEENSSTSDDLISKKMTHDDQTAGKDLNDEIHTPPAREQNFGKVQEINSDALPLQNMTHEPTDSELTVLDDLNEVYKLPIQIQSIKEVSSDSLDSKERTYKTICSDQTAQKDLDEMPTLPVKVQNSGKDSRSVIEEVSWDTLPLWKMTHEPNGRELTVVNDVDEPYTLLIQMQNLGVAAVGLNSQEKTHETNCSDQSVQEDLQELTNELNESDLELTVLNDLYTPSTQTHNTEEGNSNGLNPKETACETNCNDQSTGKDLDEMHTIAVKEHSSGNHMYSVVEEFDSDALPLQKLTCGPTESKFTVLNDLDKTGACTTIKRQEQTSGNDPVAKRVNCNARPWQLVHEPNDSELTVLNDSDERCTLHTQIQSTEKVSVVEKGYSDGLNLQEMTHELHCDQTTWKEVVDEVYMPAAKRQNSGRKDPVAEGNSNALLLQSADVDQSYSNQTVLQEVAETCTSHVKLQNAEKPCAVKEDTCDVYIANMQTVDWSCELKDSNKHAVTALKQQNNPEANLYVVPDPTGKKKDLYVRRAVIQYPYHALAQITQNFDARSLKEGGCKVGAGSFGDVFHGRVSCSSGQNESVAIKRFKKPKNTKQSQVNLYKRQFPTEVLALTWFRHPNIVRLVGQCSEGPELCLVYEYLPLGNLARLLAKNSTATPAWDVRLRVLCNVAHALKYLHSSCNPGLIHRDVKSANVLLNNKFQGKLSDFGLATLTEDQDDPNSSFLVSEAVGTSSYMAPEAFQGRTSPRVDIYAFGMVIYETVTALPPYSPAKNMNLVTFMRELERQSKINLLILSDPRATWPSTVAGDLLKLARWCTDFDSHRRPSMIVVVEILEMLKRENSSDSGQELF